MVAIRWDVLTIGHLSRNKFWGEPATEPRRAPRCTATLIRTPEQLIVVDPGNPRPEMARILDERAGITSEAVDIVFLTHFHGDHRVGVAAFPCAVVYMGRDEIAEAQTRVAPESTEGEMLARLVPAPETIVPGVARLDTPDHTQGHCSLVFTSEGRQVIVSSDVVMTRDFFAARDYYFNTVDPAATLRSLDAIRTLADIVVPGHDNYFLIPPADRPAGG